jgi:hypothetical protein
MRVDRTAVSMAFHMQDRRGPTLISDEADDLTLGHEIVDDHFKLCETPKYSVRFVALNDQQWAIALERCGKHYSPVDRGRYRLSWRGRIGDLGRFADCASGAGWRLIQVRLVPGAIPAAACGLTPGFVVGPCIIRLGHDVEQVSRLLGKSFDGGSLGTQADDCSEG